MVNTILILHSFSLVHLTNISHGIRWHFFSRPDSLASPHSRSEKYRAGISKLSVGSHSKSSRYTERERERESYAAQVYRQSNGNSKKSYQEIEA
ncbi:hypothetical protein F4824DRAFT_441366 [Ustulina deusta]|nr:hypothetical protein F4824DRAFT_441366 [Ustulina deusta]